MINLLPPDYKAEISYGRINSKTLSWTTTVVFGIVTLLVATFVGKVTIESAKNQAVAQKASIEEQIKQTKLSDIEKQYTAFIDGMSGVKKIYSQEVLYSRLIRKLATLLPPESKLTNISLTDKDKALELNFSNSKDGLGPVILVNLTNQGEQIAGKARSLTTDAFGISLAGKGDIQSDGSVLPTITVDQKNKNLQFYIGVNDPAKTERYTQALRNGGEFSYQLIASGLIQDGFAMEFDTRTSTFKSASASLETTPQLTSYNVNVDAKYVDYSVRADSLDEAKLVETSMSSYPHSTYIETYTFEDRSLATNTLCSNGQTATQTCKVLCPDNAKTCSAADKSCTPLGPNGCPYIVRAYYDELFTTATITAATDSEKNLCINQVGAQACTHKVQAKYSQLFDKVDINKTSTCTADSSTGLLKCPVDLRAQFSPEARFYFLNATTGATQ